MIASKILTRLGFALLLGCCILAVPAAAAGKKKKPVMAPKPAVAPGNPEIFSLSARGLQRGVSAKIKLTGTNLVGLTELKLSNTNITGKLLATPAPTTNTAWIELLAARTLERGAYQLSVRNTNKESSKFTFYVDDLPQVFESIAKKKEKQTPLLKLPVSYWGVLSKPGDADEMEFEARANESLVFDVSAKTIGSKANLSLNIFNEQGALVAANNGFDNGDPLLRVIIPTTGKFRVRIADRTDAGSPDNFYRLSIGTFPVVVGCFPLAVQANQDSRIELLGVNLPRDSSVSIKPKMPSETVVPVDLEKFRLRKPLTVVVTDIAAPLEAEPNDDPAHAMNILVPGSVNGRIWPTREQSTAITQSSKKPTAASSIETDSDVFKFHAETGQTLVVETEAARRGSPLDTRIEILHYDGKPVERLLLQAVRDSHITFKAIDSVTDDLRVENWQEMDLRQYMYLQGEVCRIFRMPQGPDSGFQFYTSGGKRLNYFGTRPIAHALDEAAYIVEPHPPGTKLVPNGLPVFPLYYCNDDDAERKLGTDSRVLFTAPSNGVYLVRVTDSRGFSGDRFAYRLNIRGAVPDFKVTLNGANPTVNAGSGREFSVSADRIDGFDGDIIVSITNLPSGFAVSTPIVIQAGHLEAKGAVLASVDAKESMETNLPPIKVTAVAVVNGTKTVKEVNSLGKIKVADKPKLYVALDPYDKEQTNFLERAITEKPMEITVIPGRSIPAWLKIKRNGHEDLVTFTVENLPHGVIVDNIGLNGVLIPKDQNERQIFLTTAKWVPDSDRLCFARSAQAENQVSIPLLVHVRHTELQASAGKAN